MVAEAEPETERETEPVAKAEEVAAEDSVPVEEAGGDRAETPTDDAASNGDTEPAAEG